MVLQNTPLPFRHRDPDKSGSRSFDTHKLRYADEAKKFLGPMPVQTFLDSFLPETPLMKIPSTEDAFKIVPICTTTEKDIYVPLAQCLNAIEGSRRPGYEFVITTQDQDAVHSKAQPSICLYNKAMDQESYTTDGHAFAHLGYADLFIDTKPSSWTDCFQDPPISSTDEPTDRSSHRFLSNVAPSDQKMARDDLIRSVSYVAEACARQHRTFYFSISIVGTRARLIRWDRAGAIVTEAFDIHTHPRWLCEFLWRYAHGTDEDCGFDGTVAWADKEDEELFRTVVRQHVQLQTGFSGKRLDKAVAEHYEPNRVAVAHVLEDWSFSPDGVHAYLISRPVASPVSMAGCATRGYWAVCRETRMVGFLKDTWRPDVDGKMLEGEILRTLKEKSVANIPELVHHGDVPLKLPAADQPEMKYQDTRTEEFEYADWVCGRDVTRLHLTPRRHYRLVLGTVGYPLERLEGTKELLHATFDAYQAVIDALKKAGMLHRDISVGNILLVREFPHQVRKGYLIDWELSCLADESGHACIKNEHVGTWGFMSSRVFSEPLGFVHHIADDMESMMYVVLYCGLRWLPHNLEATDLRGFLERFFDKGVVQENGWITGGDARVVNRFTRRHTDQLSFDCPAFYRWLTTAMDCNYRPASQKPRLQRDLNGDDPFWKAWKEFLDTEDLPHHDRTSRNNGHNDQSNAVDLSGSATVVSRKSTVIGSSIHGSVISPKDSRLAKCGHPTMEVPSVEFPGQLETRRIIHLA